MLTCIQLDGFIHHGTIRLVRIEGYLILARKKKTAQVAATLNRF